jgi:hypothetical protein
MDAINAFCPYTKIPNALLLCPHYNAILDRIIIRSAPHACWYSASVMDRLGSTKPLSKLAVEWNA